MERKGMEDQQKKLILFLTRKLTYNNCVSDESEKDQMYDCYKRQMLKDGRTPVEKENVLFLSSVMSCRDEDFDATPDDARKEADSVFAYIQKLHNLNFNEVVLRIGFEPEVYVAKKYIPSISLSEKQNDGKSL